jgi:hypothetical protein
LRVSNRASRRNEARIQVHLRLSGEDDTLLRRLAEEGDQTLSGAVRYLLRDFRRRRGSSD